MSRMPVLFVSHGSPTYAIEPGLAGSQLAKLGESLPRPTAVLVVSPHWATRGVRVTVTAEPQTIHDFGGFPSHLYQIRYPAPGHPPAAHRALELLAASGWVAEADEKRGMDHGAWVPLMHLLPAADVPVFQVSMPWDLDETGALRLGQALAPLAAEGVLVVASGSLTHNLYEFRRGGGGEDPYVVEFVRWVRQVVTDGDTRRLLTTLDEAPHGRRAHPTSEHFLPLLVAAGAAGQATVAVLDGGIQHGVLAMESYVFNPLLQS